MPQIFSFDRDLCLVVLARTQQLAYDNRIYQGMGDEVPKDPIRTENLHDGASQIDLRRQSQDPL